MNVAYIHHTPFIISSNGKDPSVLLQETRFDSTLLSEEERLFAIVVKFMRENGIIDSLGEDGDFTNSKTTELNSWVWTINWIDIRSFRDKTVYYEFFTRLKDYDAVPLAKLVNLYTRIGGLFDPVFINTICNRTLQAVNLIPYTPKNQQDLISWEVIHTETPYMWLVVYMQFLIHTYGTELKEK